MFKLPFLKASADTSKPLPASKWFDSCSELPLYNFIKVITTQDLQWLVIEGSPTQEQLNNAWNEIFMEYCDLSPSPAQHYLFNLTKDIKVIEGKLAIIQFIINGLAKRKSNFLIDKLNQMGYYFEYNEDTLIQDLESIVIQAKALLVQKQVKQGEYSRYNEANKGKTVTEAEYEEILGALSQFQRYELDSKVLTVSRFVGIFNRYNKQNKHGIKSED